MCIAHSNTPFIVGVGSQFNIPNNFEPVAIIALGYADTVKASPERHSRDRKVVEDFVYYETF